MMVRQVVQKDVISCLLDCQLDDLLTRVLLHLDPGSLHQAKLVCVAWCIFIQDNIWERDSIRKRLQKQHLTRWKKADHDDREWVVNCMEEEEVVSLACDEWVLVAGLNNGLAKVYSIETCGFVNLLNCRDDYYDLGPSEEEILVYTDIGDYLIATTTSRGVVIVRNKVSYALFYKASHHGDHPVHAVCVSGDLVVTGGKQDLVVLRHKRKRIGRDDSEYMEEICRLSDHTAGVITHVDCDGSLILAGTSRCLLLWSVEAEQCLKRIPSGFINSLILHFPFGFTVGGGPSGGVWDLVSGEVIRTFGDRYYSQLGCNGRFLFATESERNLMLRDVVYFSSRDFHRGRVTVFDIQDLCDIRPEEDIFASNSDPNVVWNKNFSLSKPGFGCSAINKSCLFTAQNNVVMARVFAKN
eukprot:GFUD01002610.1.p1 GENE.GFUD01002610.1~~GFUD01002610.1.p1  ORF type:complete len:411 (-),score=77.25 GFUD01002610.1:57-1289(-)